MIESDYSKREVDLILTEIRGLYKTHSEEDNHHFSDMKESINELTEHVKKTNGRVSSLEKWQAYITGGMTVLTIIVVPLLGWALWILSNVESQVHEAVDNALAAYEITK